MVTVLEAEDTFVPERMSKLEDTKEKLVKATIANQEKILATFRKNRDSDGTDCQTISRETKWLVFRQQPNQSKRALQQCSD